MKIFKSFVNYIFIVLCIPCILQISPFVLSENDIFPEELIMQYAESVNNSNIDGYIDLFTADNQDEMRCYIDDWGENDFFQEDAIEIKNVSQLSDDVGKISSAIFDDEVSEYSDIIVYYVEMNINAQKSTNRCVQNGTVYRNFVIVNENGEWKILRISSPNLKTIIEADEGFNTVEEQVELERKAQIAESLVQEAVDNSLAYREGMPLPMSEPTSDPTSITVYFTKSANQRHYGSKRESIDWTDYLENVIPLEWIVERYRRYPAYLEAGTLASKMYAWYYIENPKWDFSPYYADVKDNSSDQNFLYSVYSDLDGTAQGYVDDVMSYVRNIAMCQENGDLFEVHYHMNQGTKNSGTLNESEAYSMAKNGKSTSQILSYFYSYSDYNPGRIVLFGYV